jgi:hypothetical protein
MDLDISSDSDLESAILEDLLPKPRRPRQVSKNDIKYNCNKLGIN